MRELPASRWVLPDARTLPDGIDYAGSGMDWDPATVLNAYASGYFPMPRSIGSPEIDWWSPDPRAVFDPAAVRIARSLRQSMRKFRVTVNAAFDDVVTACANPTRTSRWIDNSVQSAYGRLHREGWAHSIEVWEGTRLVGGLYGIEIGGLFAGESMFHTARDASKVALVGLAVVLQSGPEPRRIDSQWMTEHLRSMGAVEVSRSEYVNDLPKYLANTEVLAGLARGSRIGP